MSVTLENPDSLSASYIGESFGIDYQAFSDSQALYYEAETHVLGERDYTGTLIQRLPQEQEEAQDQEILGVELKVPLAAAHLKTIIATEPGKFSLELDEEVEAIKEIHVKDKIENKTKIITIAVVGSTFVVSAAAYGVYLAIAKKKQHN